MKELIGCILLSSKRRKVAPKVAGPSSLETLGYHLTLHFQESSLYLGLLFLDFASAHPPF